MQMATKSRQQKLGSNSAETKILGGISDQFFEVHSDLKRKDPMFL